MPESELIVQPRCLMIYVDETGHEEFADPNHPVCGYAGCMVMAGSAAQTLVNPWKAMKAEYFRGAEVPLHASELQPNNEQAEAIGRFFRTQPFGRFGVTMTGKTTLPERIKAMALMPGILAKRWTNLASRFSPPAVEVAILFESSQRLDPLVERHFGEIAVQVDGHAIPVHHGFIEKRLALAELEVADFIANAAGGHAMSQFRGQAGFRKDYQAVFQANGDWVSFMTVDAVTITPEEGLKPADIIDAPPKGG